MRQVFLLLASLLASWSLNAQNETISRFTDKYAHDESVTRISLSGGFLNLFRDDDEEAGSATSSPRLDALEIISFDDPRTIANGDIAKLYQGIRAEAYEELVRVRNEGDWVQVYLLEDAAQRISDVVLLVDGKDSFCLVHLTGDMAYGDLNRIDIDDEQGGGALRNLNKERGVPQP